MSTRQSQLQEELEKARAELASTVDELGERLDPRAQATRFADTAKQAATDTAGLFTGEGLPRQADRSRNVKVVLTGAAVLAALVVRSVVRRR